MTKSEARTLLMACHSLAERLAALGVDIELSEQDRAALVGLNRVLDTDWLIDPDVLRQAGLNRTDVGMLVVLAIQTEANEERQHESGGG